MTTSDFASKRTVRCRGCNKFKRMRKPPNPVRVRHGSGANMNGERLRPRFIERVTQMTHCRAELICKNDGTCWNECEGIASERLQKARPLAFTEGRPSAPWCTS